MVKKQTYLHQKSRAWLIPTLLYTADYDGHSLFHLQSLSATHLTREVRTHGGKLLTLKSVEQRRIWSPSYDYSAKPQAISNRMLFLTTLPQVLQKYLVAK